VAPDLIVHFGGLYWRSIGGVGYPGLHLQEHDAGPATRANLVSVRGDFSSGSITHFSDCDRGAEVYDPAKAITSAIVEPSGRCDGR